MTAGKGRRRTTVVISNTRRSQTMLARFYAKDVQALHSQQLALVQLL